MAKVLDARAAALEIRGKMKQPSPEDRHIEKFVGEVLDALGMEHTIANAAMVVHALRDADIQPHRVEEYPKAVTVKVVDKAKYGDEDEHDVVHIAHDADEEQRILHGEPEPPVEEHPLPEGDDAPPADEPPSVSAAPAKPSGPPPATQAGVSYAATTTTST